MGEESVTRAGRFAELLKASGLTLEEFAERVGKAPATVARWKGKVPEYALAYLELLVASKPRPTDWQLVEKVLPDGERLVE